MSALLTSRPRAREERLPAGQGLLFGDAPVVEEQRAQAAASDAAAVAETMTMPVPDAVAPPAAATLDAAITSLWSRLTAAEPSACPVCEAAMEPRHSAGAGVVGGRCRSCGSTLS
jgi:hypothetical protein